MLNHSYATVKHKCIDCKDTFETIRRIGTGGAAPKKRCDRCQSKFMSDRAKEYQIKKRAIKKGQEK